MSCSLSTDEAASEKLYKIIRGFILTALTAPVRFTKTELTLVTVGTTAAGQTETATAIGLTTVIDAHHPSFTVVCFLAEATVVPVAVLLAGSDL